MISAPESDVAQQNYPSASLYVVGTPIGNVCDIGLRALHVLSIADTIACEDTRNTAQLLTRYGLSKPLLTANQHNEREAAVALIERLSAGERVALVSDAGTPGVSDPGGRIVEMVHEKGFRVIPIPGPSAAVTALSASGNWSDEFYFVGFLPTKSSQRDTKLKELLRVTATLIFYEAPHRINETIEALSKVFEPSRKIVVARELTKLFEEIHRCSLADVAKWLGSNQNHQKGEFVLLLEGAPQSPDDELANAENVLKILLDECPLKQAVSLASKITGAKKNLLYERALQLRQD